MELLRYSFCCVFLLFTVTDYEPKQKETEVPIQSLILLKVGIRTEM